MIFSQKPFKKIDFTFGGNRFDRAYKTIENADGSMVILGDSFSDISGDKTEKSRGVTDIWVLKIDRLGNKIWDRTIGSDDYDSPVDIIKSKDGGYIILANSGGNISKDKSKGSQGAKGEKDIWIIKINKEGETVWDKIIGGDGEDRADSIIDTQDNSGYIIAGTSSSNISGSKSESCRGRSDFWIIKINKNGDKLWDKTIGGENHDVSRGIIQKKNGDFIIIGFSESRKCTDKMQEETGGWIVKLDSKGRKIWDKYIENARSIYNTKDGGFVIAGGSASKTSKYKTEDCKGNWDFWINKFNSKDEIEWDKTIGGSGEDMPISIIQTYDLGYVVVGYSKSNISGDKSENIKGGQDDFWIVKLGMDGKKIWDKTLGGTGRDVPLSVIEASNHNYILSGYSDSNKCNDKIANGKGEYDVWIVIIEELK